MRSKWVLDFLEPENSPSTFLGTVNRNGKMGTLAEHIVNALGAEVANLSDYTGKAKKKEQLRRARNRLLKLLERI